MTAAFDLPEDDDDDSPETELPNWTDEDLAKFRADTLKQFPQIQRFTCDDCELRKNCEYVFDAYNTDDDCLLSK